MVVAHLDGTKISNPKVSVVIPNYNYSRFLDERFRSILSQSYRDYEIIFLDDASTDDSVVKVKNEFSEYINQIEVNDCNSGNPFVQWNKGVRMARGEFVWIAEADDCCTDDFLEKMLHAIEQSPSIGLAYCNTIPFDSDGKVIDENFHLRYLSDLDAHRWEHDFQENGKVEVRKYIARKNTITNVSGVIFRRDAYIKAGYAPESLRMCGDWLTYCRILHDFDVAYVCKPMNFHRQHPNKHTQNSVLDLTYFREFLQVQEYVVKAFETGRIEKKEAFHRFLGEWDRLTISHYGRIGFARTLTLAQMTAKSYSGISNYFIIAIHLLTNTFKSLAAKWLIK